MVEARAGEIVLSIKHDTPLDQTRQAIDRLGGLEAIADRMPHVFDYLRILPMGGYDK